MKVLTVYAHPNPRSFCHAILERFTQGLRDAGHTCEVVDLHAIHFNPVFDMQDYASYLDEHIPAAVLERMDLRQSVLNAAGGPIQRFIASRWLQGKGNAEIARFVHTQMPRDVRTQQQKVAGADGLAFIAPVLWMGFPAILRGWFERVFTYGFAYHMDEKGWNGDLSGRVPLLKHEKALVISTTLFCEADYQAGGWNDVMTKLVDDFALRFPGVRRVEHVFFYAVPVVDHETRRGYLQRAYDLGKEFAVPEHAPAELVPSAGHAAG